MLKARRIIGGVGGGGGGGSTPNTLNLSDFGGIADGQIFTDGTTNFATAHDNTAAIKSWGDACIATNSIGIIPPGDWVFRGTPTFTGGFHMKGYNDDTRLIYVPPNNKKGITFGTTLTQANVVDAKASPLSLVTGTTTVSNILELATTAVGETPTQRLSKGMLLYLADPSQGIPVRTVAYNPGAPSDNAKGICFYKGDYTTVVDVIDDTHILISGVTTWDLNAGTKVGYWPLMLENVIVEDLMLVYDIQNSFQGGVASAFQFNACLDMKMYNIKVLNATSRAIGFSATYGIDLDTVFDVSTLSPEGGSLMTASGNSGKGIFRNLKSEGGTHCIDFGGNIWTPCLHHKVYGVHARGAGGGAVGSHAGAGFVSFTDIEVIGSYGGWNTDNDPDTDELDKDSGITIRGPYTTVQNARVFRVAQGLRSHFVEHQSWKNCKTYGCGTGMLVENTTEMDVRDIEHFNPVFRGTQIDATVGAPQNVPTATNMKFDDVRVTGMPGTQGDCVIRTNTLTLEKAFREDGWSLTRFTQNGYPAVFVGDGTSVGLFPTFTTGPTSDIGTQLVNPAYSIAVSLGAMTSAVSSTAGVTDAYDGAALLEIIGGTLATGGFPTVVRVETLEIQSVDINNPGENYVAGSSVITAAGGQGTAFTYAVDTVGANGEILTGHLVTKGVYTVAPETFGQASTTDAGDHSSSIVSATTISQGSGWEVGDTGIFAGGSPVIIAGVKQRATFVADTVGPAGELLTLTVTDGGNYLTLPPSGNTGLFSTSGEGSSKTTFDITTLDRKMTFKNALPVPLSTSVARAGKYTVGNTPTNPASHVDGGQGAGATFNLTYGNIVDVGQAPKTNVLVATTGSATLDGFGPRRGVQRKLFFQNAKTITASATVVMPNGGGSIVTEAGDSCIIESDFSIPVIWTMSNYTRASGLPLRTGTQGAVTAKTNGALLTAAEIKTGIITINAADNLADNYQLPTGTNMSAAFTTLNTNDFFTFYMIDLNANAAATGTITTNTDWTLVGNMLVAASTSGVFRAVKTGATTWTLYRLSG